jgi:hypothetical protein
VITPRSITPGVVIPRIHPVIAISIRAIISRSIVTSWAVVVITTIELIKHILHFLREPIWSKETVWVIAKEAIIFIAIVAVITIIIPKSIGA